MKPPTLRRTLVNVSVASVSAVVLAASWAGIVRGDTQAADTQVNAVTASGPANRDITAAGLQPAPFPTTGAALPVTPATATPTLATATTPAAAPTTAATVAAAGGTIAPTTTALAPVATPATVAPTTTATTTATPAAVPTLVPAPTVQPATAAVAPRRRSRAS